ncbi:hypothetical protein DFH06DRAFT_1152843 [Mycena polygramma]|nr:hypothetical protein DFH06DRAFT_1152843 [Mycena polygramma]
MKRVRLPRKSLEELPRIIGIGHELTENCLFYHGPIWAECTVKWASNAPKINVTSSLTNYVQLVPVFSVEIISEILAFVALDRDLSANSIISGAKDIRNILLSCKHFRAICRTVPEAWINIPAIPPASIHVDVAPIWFENAIHLSRNRPLRIVYKLPLAVSVGPPFSDALRIWNVLFTHRPRWEAFHLIGSRRCHLPFVCVKHLAATANFTHSTPNLRALTVNTPSRPFACPQHPPNDPVLVHVEKLQTLSSCFALELPVAGPLNLPIPTLYADLVRLDLDKQPLFTWQHILKYAPRLDELVWRSGNTIVDPAGSTTILLPLLRRLELESVHPLPPISTPGLQELIVTDQQTAFDQDKFNALVGSGPTHPLRVLDLLHNPIPNYDINLLLAKCQDLTYISMDTLNRDRSTCFEKLTDRIALAYATDRIPRLRVVQFSSVPTFTVTLNRFQPLMRLGSLIGPTLIIHDAVFRVICKGCRGRFLPNDPSELDKFRFENKLDGRLVTIVKKGVDYDLADAFCIILIFSDHTAAAECTRGSVRYRGRICSSVQEL